MIIGTRIQGYVKQLRRDASGVAMIEFALALPLVAMVTVSGLEIAWYAAANQKVNQIAAQAADNAARVKNTIDETDIIEIMTAARLNGENMDFTENGRVIISSIQLNDRGDGQWIRWQRCEGDKKVSSAYGKEGQGEKDASLDGIGKNAPKMRAASGIAIILAEVQYEYQPLISSVMFKDTVMKAETAYVVRQRTDLDLTNTTSLGAAQRKLCN